RPAGFLGYILLVLWFYGNGRAEQEGDFGQILGCAVMGWSLWSGVVVLVFCKGVHSCGVQGLQSCVLWSALLSDAPALVQQLLCCCYTELSKCAALGVVYFVMLSDANMALVLRLWAARDAVIGLMLSSAMDTANFVS
ncbi:hypothetical protein U1Q18_030970, partial [Sarracenia purpurea var. burkii]